MKLRTLVKTALASSIVLLCTGFAVFFFLRISDAEKRREFDLYSLVPPNATAVLETDDMDALVENIAELNCSKDGHFLHVSKIFSSLKNHLSAFVNETPHGLSRQMNKMLISFHEPDNDRNQVLYCSLNSNDHKLLDTFARKYSLDAFPPKIFKYKGEKITIYTLSDGDFLVAYLTSDFFVVSYQKRLIEAVIDARLSGKSLIKEFSFARMQKVRKSEAKSVVYVRMQSLDMGRMTDNAQSRATLGGWTEFDIKMNGDAIYFSGLNHDTDTGMTFMNMLRKQHSVSGFPGSILPVSAYFLSRRSINNLQAVFDLTSSQQKRDTTSVSPWEKDNSLLEYLKTFGKEDIVTCLFQREDTISLPAAIACFPLNDSVQAERMLPFVVANSQMDPNAPPKPATTFHYTSNKAYPLYALLQSKLFAQLTGIASETPYVFATVYGKHLLLASNAKTLSYYIRRMEKRETLDRNPAYRESVSGLSDVYRFMLVADLNSMFLQPEVYVRLVPGFFFRNADFFRHFILSAQFSNVEEAVYANVVLLYKGE